MPGLQGIELGRDGRFVPGQDRRLPDDILGFLDADAHD